MEFSRFINIYAIHAPKSLHELGQKKNKSVSCSRSENCNAECVFFFFFYNSWKSNAQCGFYFFKQNFRKKIHQNNSLGFFSTFIKNITSFISKWFMWPFILHALGASVMNFLPWPKLHHAPSACRINGHHTFVSKALWYRTFKKLDCSLIWNFYRMYHSIHSSNCANFMKK